MEKSLVSVRMRGFLFVNKNRDKIKGSYSRERETFRENIKTIKVWNRVVFTKYFEGKIVNL